MVEKYVPRQGDAVWINLNPQAGHEQSGKRPALVISPYLYNKKTGLAIFCPITNQVKGYPFEVVLPEGIAVTGAILSDHVKNLDWRARSAKFICRLPDNIFEEVLRKITVLIKATDEF
jgi:mRNA interferase MazF